MKDLIVKRNVLNKGIIDKIAVEKKINEIFEFYKNKENTNITNEKNEKGKADKNKVDHNEYDMNEMTNTLEKAKELLPSDDKRIEELAHLIEVRKEEIAKLAAAPKGKTKKK